MKSLLAALAACSFVGTVAQAQIVNGGFELPGTGFRSVGNGQTFGGWTCSGPNDIEFVRAEPNAGLPGLQFSAYEGQYWIDLDGVGAPSGIFQNIVGLIPGASYRVDFAFAANLWGPNFNFVMDVLWNGQSVGQFARVAGGSNGAQMNWSLEHVDVQANITAGPNRLEFRALTGINARGPAIDAVSMTLVPTPGAGAVLGLAVISCSRRRR